MASVFRETVTVCKSQWFLFCSSPYIFRVVTTVYEHQRFLFRLRPDVFSMRSLWVSLVFILFIAVSVSEVEDPEYRYGVYIGFCLKPTHIQGSYNSLSSVFRLLLIEPITFPFHLQKSKYSLSISLSPRSIFCNNRLLWNFLLSPSTLYGPTL
mgnify:CR=1 FL=1